MVVDASMTLAWHFRDEKTPQTHAVFAMTDDHAVVVPQHWFAEVANALVMGERRARATAADSAFFVERLADFDLTIDDLMPQESIARILPLARAHGLTVYDTFYLELAQRRGLPLASLDRDLCDAARSVGVTILTDTI